MVEEQQTSAVIADNAKGGSNLNELVSSKSILISVGAGGVGKTTTAAAIGLLGARARRKTLVMTIDPAKRLAVSLGLERLDQTQRPVPEQKLAQAGLDHDLLFAMMLDQKRSFDEVVEHHAPDRKTYDRVINNKLYRELSTRLAGGQEYAAMVKLYEIVHAATYDLLVLDTPPTANAFDFLDAPGKMVGLLEGPAVKLFVKSYQQAGRFSFKVLTFGAAFVFRRIARFVGGPLLDDISQFFGDLYTMLDDFRLRSREAGALLRREDVGFVIVTSPDARAVDEAITFKQRLEEGGMRPAAFVINRVHPLQQPKLPQAQVIEALSQRGTPPAMAQQLAPILSRAQDCTSALAAADAEQIERLRQACGPGVPYVQVPLLDDDIYDIGGLIQLGSYLSG